MTTSTLTVSVATSGRADITFTDEGHGRPILLLHGGAGPRSVAAFAHLLAEREHARVLVPTHPGFDGTPRPAWLESIGGLARLYGALLDELGLTDVTVVGNSIGGWITAELALTRSPRVRSVVLVSAVGIDVADAPVTDIFALPLEQIAALSYHNPEAFRIDPARMAPEQRAAMAENRATLRTYAGNMTDPGLHARLEEITTPTLVIWGESDQICTPAYGRAYAAAIPGARFELMREAGHLPQIETPDRLATLIWAFSEEHAERQTA